MLTKLFSLNDLINETVRYPFGLECSEKKLLRHLRVL